MTALRPECRAVFGFIKIPKISLWLREFMRGEVPSLQDHPVSKRRGWSSKGTQPFEPEESKETALGFRGTRLWLQSLVCYTFAKAKATRAGSTLPVPAIANQPFCPLLSKGISPSSFVPIFRCVWRYAEIFSPFCCISPKLFCHRKNPLTSCANP